MVLMCIPARLYLHPRLFSEDELTLLDGSPEEIDRWLQKNDPEGETPDKSGQAQHIAQNGLKMPDFDDDAGPGTTDKSEVGHA